MADHHHEGGAHHSADDEYLPVEGSSYEHTDAHVGAIIKFGVWLVVIALLVHVGMGLMYAMLIDQSRETEHRYPLASGTEPKLPPEPRLQQYPHIEMRGFRDTEIHELTEYGWVNRDAGVVRLPIADAMRLTVERGLPARAEDPERPSSPPGMLATDASAGRVMERRRQ